MRILVTGGHGFIGMYVTSQLIQNGHNVVILDNTGSPPKGFESLCRGSKAIVGDVLDKFTLFEVARENRIQRVIHLAATRNWYSQEHPYTAFNVNCASTLNLFEVARLCEIERIAFASTVGVFGSSDLYARLGVDPLDLPEGTLGAPFNVYGVTKLFDELMAIQYAARYSLSIVGFRLPLIFGPGKKAGSKTSRYNDLIERAYAGRPVTINAKSDQQFNLQYVRDSAKAAVCSCLAAKPGHVIYNTGGYRLDVREYIRLIRQIIPKAEISLIEEEGTDICDTCINSDLAKKEIGYWPDYTIAEGIADHIRTIAVGEA